MDYCGMFFMSYSKWIIQSDQIFNLLNEKVKEGKKKTSKKTNMYQSKTKQVFQSHNVSLQPYDYVKTHICIYLVMTNI